LFFCALDILVFSSKPLRRYRFGTFMKSWSPFYLSVFDSTDFRPETVLCDSATGLTLRAAYAVQSSEAGCSP
jgi:hypothetical protein